MIAGAVQINLTANDAHRDRHALGVLAAVPTGASVTVDIGSRKYVTQDAAAWLHLHDDRLAITVIGSDPVAVLTFVTAARAGGWL